MRRRSLLRLYPSHWRQRYEEEVGALVDAAPLSVGLVVDLLRGAFEAHIHPELGAPSLLGSTGSGQIPLTPPSPANRLARVAMLTVLIVMLVATGAVGYYLGWSQVSPVAEPAPFPIGGSMHTFVTGSQNSPVDFLHLQRLIKDRTGETGPSR